MSLTPRKERPEDSSSLSRALASKSRLRSQLSRYSQFSHLGIQCPPKVFGAASPRVPCASPQDQSRRRRQESRRPWRGGAPRSWYCRKTTRYLSGHVQWHGRRTRSKGWPEWDPVTKSILPPFPPSIIDNVCLVRYIIHGLEVQAGQPLTTHVFVVVPAADVGPPRVRSSNSQTRRERSEGGRAEPWLLPLGPAWR